MLVLKRRDGEWVEVKHKSGDTLRFRVYNVGPTAPGSPVGKADLAFDDAARNFSIQRPERVVRPAAPQEQ